MSREIIVGSLSDIAIKTSRHLAECILDVDGVILCDISGSMQAADSRDDQTRWQVAGQELVKLQESMPGKLALIAFSDRAEFVPSGILPRVGKLGMGTNLSGALKFSKVLDVADIKFIIVSDGEPNDRDGALAIARTIKANISVVYVGSERDTHGRKFLKQLANASRGQFAESILVKELAVTAQLLLKASA